MSTCTPWSHKCIVCGKNRRRNGTKNRCSDCARAVGLLPPVKVQRHTTKAERAAAAQRVQDRTFWEPPTRIVDGIEYEVIFDGSVR